MLDGDFVRQLNLQKLISGRQLFEVDFEMNHYLEQRRGGMIGGIHDVSALDVPSATCLQAAFSRKVGVVGNSPELHARMPWSI